MLAFHRDRAALATIALFHPANLGYYSRLEIDVTKKLRRMRLLVRRNPLQYDDYPPNLEEGVAAALSGLMYCGVIIAEPAVLNLIPPRTPWSLMPGLFRPDGSQRATGLRLRSLRLLPHDGRSEKLRRPQSRSRVVATIKNFLRLRIQVVNSTDQGWRRRYAVCSGFEIARVVEIGN